MSDDLKHECGVAMVVLRNPPDNHSGDFGGTKLSLLMDKQHNRGQDGAGAAILAANPEPGALPYWIAKSASETPLADVLAALARRHVPRERIFLGHLRYATYGKGDEAFCHPFVHEASELEHTLLLAGNFNLTNTAELFEAYRRQGEFPTSKSDGYLICEMLARELGLATPSPGPARALATVLPRLDGAWTLCGMTGDGWAFATRDPNGIRPGWYYASEEVVMCEDGNPRTLMNSFIQGTSVFTFTVFDVPRLIKDFFAQTDTTPDQYDCFAFHQANLYILKQIAKKSKIDFERMPITLDRYGNTSGASAIVSLCDRYGNDKENKTIKVMACGFGIGISLGATSFDLYIDDILPIFEDEAIYEDGLITDPNQLYEKK